jgi:predicted amidohydrolase YtcJ
MNKLLRLYAAGLILVISCSKPEAFDLLVVNGTVYTQDMDQPVASAVGVIQDKIAYVGDGSGLESRISDETEILNLTGQTMTPGWIEGHGHFMGMGYSKLQLDLAQAKNYQEVVDMVARAVKERQPGEWILGRGWHQSKWDPQPDTLIAGFQTHYKLSRVSPDNPVYLEHASGHAGFANAKAMEIAGIKNMGIEESPQVAGDGVGRERDRGALGDPERSAQNAPRRFRRVRLDGAATPRAGAAGHARYGHPIREPGPHVDLSDRSEAVV